jgi:sigma-E factor negative regulatory protein RseA
MTELHTTQHEHLSALVDGELQGPALQSAMAAVLADPHARNTWHAYQVIGDVLRSGELSGASQDLQFLAKLEGHLAKEPLLPRTTDVTQVTGGLPSRLNAQSANSPIFWRVLAGVACSISVAVIGLSVWSPIATPSSVTMATTSPPVTTNLAQSEPVNVALGPDGMLRDPKLDQLLSAHQQLGGHSALQMPSGFLRNATYEGAGR